MDCTSQQPIERAGRLALLLTCIFTIALTVLSTLEAAVHTFRSPFNYLLLGITVLLGAAAGLAVLRWVILAARACVLSPTLSRNWRSPIFPIVAVWCVWSFIACFIAVREGYIALRDNVRPLYYVASCLLVIFPLGYFLGRQQRMTFLHTISDICIWIFAIYLSCAYLRFLRGETIFSYFGREINFEFARIRFGRNVNSFGAYSGFFFMAGLYRLFTIREKWKKALMGFAVMILYITFAFSESRGSIVAFAVAVGVYGGVYAYRKQKKAGVRAVVFSVISGIGSLLAFLFIFYGSLELLHRAQAAHIAHIGAVTGTEPAADTVFAARGIDTESLTRMNGRTGIWKAVIRDFFHEPHIMLHGCSQPGIPLHTVKILPYQFSTHNLILEVLMGYGLPGGVLFLAWLVWTAGKSISVGLGKEYAGTPLWTLPLLLLMLIINNMAEAMLIGSTHPTGFFFFLIAGYVGGLAARAKHKEKQP